tara:strand:- start:166 stop:369 length:204 start_codon:yes stop_codon:yes gene_type:complete
MFKVLIPSCIGVVLILLLRTHKEKETIPVFNYEQREEIYNGDSTTYLRFTRTPEDKKRKDGQGFDTN